MRLVTTTRLDGAAIGLSLGCAAHCLALPMAAAFLPFLEAAAEAEWVHWVMFGLAAPVTILALRHAHTPWLLRVVAAIGLLGILLGAVGWPDHEWEAPLTIAGGTVLAIVHLINTLHVHPRSARFPSPAPETGVEEASGL